MLVRGAVRKTTNLLAIDVAIRQGHGRIVFVHGLPREAADQVGLGTVGEG